MLELMNTGTEIQNSLLVLVFTAIGFGLLPLCNIKQYINTEKNMQKVQTVLNDQTVQ